MASCAFFNFAADTIFMALVICMVDFTDAILFRISFKFAILLFCHSAFNAESIYYGFLPSQE
jgi:hypothetical protein